MRELLEPRYELPNGAVIARGLLIVRSSIWSVAYLARLNGFDPIGVFDRTFMKSKRIFSSVGAGVGGQRMKLAHYWQLPLPDGLYELQSKGKFRGNIKGLSPWRCCIDCTKGKIKVLHHGQAIALLAERTGQKPPCRRVPCSRDEIEAAYAARRLGREDIAKRIVGKYLIRN